MNQTALNRVLMLAVICAGCILPACDASEPSVDNDDTEATPAAGDAADEAPADGETAEPVDTAEAPLETQPADKAEPAPAGEADDSEPAADTEAGEEPAAKAAEIAPDITDETVIARAGDDEITAGELRAEVAAILAQASPRQAGRVTPRRVLDSLLRKALIEAYVEAQDLKLDDQAFDEMKAQLAKQAESMGMTVEEVMAKSDMTMDDLKLQIKMRSHVQGLTTPQKLQAFIDEHPSYFDGTKVTASHILIKLEPAATTADQKADLAKLIAIKKQIEAGEIDFAEAARKHSQGPSSVDGGELPKFTFYKMLAPFATKAFAMKAGEISDPVRTKYGFHIIHKAGEAKDEQARTPPLKTKQKIAATAISSQVRNDVMDQALEDEAIVVTDAGETMIAPAPADDASAEAGESADANDAEAGDGGDATK
ncbi:MAG: peptidylprolyl isomerase [Phycisphaerae bacterium]|nr:peptidylprolyl isomerase [Phycisphaerae bacterium]